jgi:hypothetical protein
MTNRTTDYFSPDYQTARRRFRDAVGLRGGRLDTLKLAGRGPHDEDLTIDIGWFGAAMPRRLLVHSSGVHGVEGFAGSAIQLQWLAENIPTLASDSAIALVHMLNPYGAAWLRRVNENNVDLNRNFGAARTAHRESAREYAALDSLLNPRSPPRQDFFLVRSARLVLLHGMVRLRQTVIGGQTTNPKGLFYAGENPEPAVSAYESYLRDRLRHANRIVAIDVHTGFGRYGEDTLMVDAATQHARVNAQMHAAFGPRVQLSDGTGTAYRVDGSQQDMYTRLVPGAEVHFATQEFGTLRPLRVLAALRAENRWHHYGGGDVSHPVKRRLLEVFCPADERWRAAVLNRGAEVLAQAGLLAFKSSPAQAAGGAS